MTRTKRSKTRKIFDRIKVKPGKVYSTHLKSFIYVACPYTKTLYDSYIYPIRYDGNYEYLEYKIHSCKPYNTVLPCKHVKNVVTPFPLTPVNPVSKATKSCSGVTVPTTKFTYDYGEMPFMNFADGYREPTIPDLSQAHREAIDFFASGCQPLEVNLAVNLTEIGDTLSLVKDASLALIKLKKVYTTGRFPISWKSYVRKLKRGEHNLEWDVSGKLAEAYLAYSFAIAPLISDIKKLSDAVSNVKKRVQWFIRNNKNPVPVRFTKDLSSAVSLGAVQYPTTSSWYTAKVLTAYKATYKAFALATYDVSGLTSNDLSSKLLKKALGFSDPIEFLWEKIPFSFVIDWVVSVGDYLSTFDSTKMCPYVLAMVGHSVNIEATYTHYAQHLNTTLIPEIIFKGIFACDQRSYYSRQPGIPVTYTGLSVSPPTLKQLSLALALGRSFFHK